MKFDDIEEIQELFEYYIPEAKEKKETDIVLRETGIYYNHGPYNRMFICFMYGYQTGIRETVKSLI